MSAVEALKAARAAGVELALGGLPPTLPLRGQFETRTDRATA
jgi:hypothetical protein